MLLPDEGFHHPDAPEIFLHHAVKLVVGAEYTLKDGVGVRDDQGKPCSQNRDGHQKHQGQPGIDLHCHNQGKDQHGRRAHGDPDDHLIGVLHVGHIRGQPGDQAGGGKAVNIGEGVVLHMVEHLLPQIFRKAGGGLGGVMP